MDPREATDAAGVRIDDLIFSSLVRMGPELKIVGEAAIRWTVSENVASFELRPGLTFSDGSPFTTEDLRFTFAEYQKPTNRYNSVLKSVASIDLRYDNEKRFVKFVLKEPSATFLSDLAAIKFLPKRTI